MSQSKESRYTKFVIFVVAYGLDRWTRLRPFEASGCGFMVVYSSASHLNTSVFIQAYKNVKKGIFSYTCQYYHAENYSAVLFFSISFLYFCHYFDGTFVCLFLNIRLTDQLSASITRRFSTTNIKARKWTHDPKPVTSTYHSHNLFPQDTEQCLLFFF